MEDRGIKYYQVQQTPTSYNFTISPVEDTNGNEITYLCQIPSVITNAQPIGYRIIEKDYWKFKGKATITVELNSLVQNLELEWLATTLRNNLLVHA